VTGNDDETNPKLPRTPEPAGNPDAAGDPDESPKLEMDPELEAAMREAIDAIPDGAKRREEKAEEELVLANPIEEPPGKEALRFQTQLAESHDRLLRLQADFDNFRRRAAREHQEAMQLGPQNLVQDLHSVVDNLDRAIDHARKSEAGQLQGLLQGVELVQRELLSVLEKHHVTEIEARGKPFNPAFHEAMAQVPNDSVPANTVIEVLQKGYQLRDRLLRPAQVVVTKAPEGAGGGGQAAAE
jgi:molecular chaperone GrpE